MLIDKLRNAWSRLTGRAIIPPGVTIGSRVHIGTDVRIDWSHAHHITIEDDVTLVAGARVLAHDASSYRRIGLTWVAPVTLRRGCFVGADALVLPGVTIGEDAVVAAGAVVTCDVAPGIVVAGVPARQITTVAELDGERTRDSATVPIYAEAVYNRHPLSRDVIGELRRAAGSSGYFLARVPGAVTRGPVSLSDVVPPGETPAHASERAS